MSSLLALHLFAFLFAYWILLQSTAKCWRIIPLTIPHICHFSPRAQFLVTFFTKSILYGVQESCILVVGCFGFCSSHLQCNAMQLQSINLHLHFRKRYDNCHWEGSQRLLTWWVEIFSKRGIIVIGKSSLYLNHLKGRFREVCSRRSTSQLCWIREHLSFYT